MANRRMVNIRIIDSDHFLELPLSSQALYFHLLMRADDDGFINNPKRIQRLIGGSEDDFKLLIAKKYILTFDSGVIVIKHWRMHNYIKPDRYHETECKIEKSMLFEDQNKAYSLEEPQCIQNGTILEPGRNPRLGKVRLGKDSLNNNILPEQAGQPKQENDNQASDETSYQGAREFTMLIKDGEYVVTEKTIREFEKLYPDLDVVQELRKIKAWCINNPSRRKTKRGMSRFINGWMNRAYVQFVQEPKEREAARQSRPPVQHNFEQRDYDFKDLEAQLLKKQLEDGGV